MSDRPALHLEMEETPERVELAVQQLKQDGVVILENRIVLRPCRTTIRCEVLDDGTRNIAGPEHQIALLEARLRSTRLWEYLGKRKLEWILMKAVVCPR